MSPTTQRPKRNMATLPFMAALLMSGCVAEYEDSFEGDRADQHDILFESEGYRENPLLIPLMEPFDMCFENSLDRHPHAGYGVDLNAAKWLSFFAANEYAHYARFAPVLERMGFGDIGEGEDWVESGREVLRKREAVADGKLGMFRSAYFERDLVQKVIPGKKIQFFAAGEIEGGKFHDESTQMLWAEHRTEPVVIIGFRGTEIYEAADIVADLKIIRNDIPGYGAAHRGILNAYKGVEKQLKAKLEAESGRGLQIWVTGHSLGGALASIASTTILEHLKEDKSYSFKGVYTFGQPRVGNVDFVAALENGYDSHDFYAMRFRHGDDIVTQLPWQWLGYHQVGKLMHLRGEGDLDFKPLIQDPGDTTEAGGTFADHSVHKNYHRRIWNHVNEPDNHHITKICPVPPKKTE